MTSTHQKPPWQLSRASRGSDLLPGVPVYEFQRGADASVTCIAQTDLDQLYGTYPGLKKLIVAEMRGIGNAKAYYKTKPNENRADFQACFSNNATNGKCLVPLAVVSRSVHKLNIARSVRQTAITSFVGRLSAAEREWALSELAESLNVRVVRRDQAQFKPQPVQLTRLAVPRVVGFAAQAQYDEEAQLKKNVVAAAAAAPAASPASSFFANFARQRGLASLDQDNIVNNNISNSEVNNNNNSESLFADLNGMELPLNDDHKRKRTGFFESQALLSSSFGALSSSGLVSVKSEPVDMPDLIVPPPEMPPLFAASTPSNNDLPSSFAVRRNQSITSLDTLPKKKRISLSSAPLNRSNDRALRSAFASLAVEQGNSARNAFTMLSSHDPFLDAPLERDEDEDVTQSTPLATATTPAKPRRAGKFARVMQNLSSMQERSHAQFSI